ncbi:hypothetical protein PF005_g2971 [Phytophthora fragariae]|uniref:Uncharacterized protein n=2 Tax=Phytophthora TaxID=4783 RepID=A0A6A3TDL4_9STRA|nr:hypothetical protein PF003_g14456 [Phytophthora fragariae]KAE9033968.1 hypothetical protein PR002_g8384 [Phytophthora rubi]KAE8946886.1 hypothetical protein PF009_g3490 [Phytophthora fragariae]KAE9026218.1 hypothetical protein PF011_g2662 [Phytophthora fragariae]KAE9042425.1 hypothetical protein PR001_g6201 [Phytophthora rubi]
MRSARPVRRSSSFSCVSSGLGIALTSSTSPYWPASVTWSTLASGVPGASPR